MAIRYTASAPARDGATVAVEIDDPAFSGTPVALQLVGVRLAYGEEGRDRHDPVVASRLSVEFFVPDTEDIPAALAQATDYWRVTLKRDGSELWRGLLVEDMIARPLQQETYRLSIQAIDGLGLLEDELWLDDTGEPFEGEATLAQILASALSSLGLGLGLAAAVAWTPGGAAGSSLDATVRREALLKDGRAPSRLDVVRQIVGRFGARILQHGGRWHVVQRELFRLTGSLAASLYDATGAPEGTASVALREVLSGVRMEAHELWRPAVREAAVRYDHGPLPDLIKAGDFRTSVTRQRGEPLPPDPLDYWTLYGGSRIITAGVRRFYVGRTPDRSYLNAVPNDALEVDAIFHGSTKDPAAVRQAIYNSGNYAEQIGGEVLTGQRLLLSADVTLLYNEGEGKGRYMTYYALNIQGTNYFLKYDGTWAQSSDPKDWVQPIMDDGPEWGTNGLYLVKGQVDDASWTRLQIYADPAPASGPVRLRLYGSSDINGNKRDVKSALWDNVSVQIVDDSGETFEALVTEAWRAGRGVRLDEVAFRIGEGPIPAVSGAIRWSGSMAQSWRRAGDATDYTLDALWLDGVMRQAARPLRTRREDRSGWLPTPWKAVEDGGAVYSIEALEIDPVAVRVRLELVEVRWDAVTYVLGSAPTGEGVPVSGGGGGAAAAAGSSLAVVMDLSPAYRTGPFAVLQSDVSAGSVSQIVVDSVGGIPFLQLPPAGAYIRIVHPTTGTIVDAYVASALLDMSGMSATLEVRDVSDTTQPLTLPEDFPAGAPVWLSAIWALAHIESKVSNVLLDKGDLVVGSAGGVPARLPVGGNGQVLMADPDAPLGIKWVSFEPGAGGVAAGPVMAYAAPEGGKPLVAFEYTIDLAYMDENLLP